MLENKKETHLFILWENAREKEKEILQDIQEKFTILGMYAITWKKETFSQNLSRFYGTNLPPHCGKEQHCGNGEFLLVVVEVDDPQYEIRQTSKGPQKVNVSMFDQKTKYREMTGGGHKVHATNSEKETDHDLTLLLGKSVQDYRKEKQETSTTQKITLQQELIGYDGFSTVTEMFYVLNHCLDYAILRNYETIPEEIYVNDHNDIDIICYSYQDAAYVLNAQKVFPEEYRIHYQVKVENRLAFFDFRYVGDQYYHYAIEKQILEKRVFQKKGFYTIDDENYFFTLLYHALLHKKQFSPEYQERLKKMKPHYTERLQNQEQATKLLESWLWEKGYSITRPIDVSVQFNETKVKQMNPILFPQDTSLLATIQEKEEQNEQLRQELHQMANSLSWKITKPIRDWRTKTK